MDYPIDNLLWIEELLPPGFAAVPKKGGLAYYLEGVEVLILVEKRGTYEHKGVSYPFELWNGAIIPVEYKKQSAFFLKYLFLENHPASKDWLYIPADSEDFEDQIKQVMREINKRNPLLGIQQKSAALTEEKKAAPPRTKKPLPVKKADKKKENALFLSIAKKSK
jgi:hypothetical protein